MPADAWALHFAVIEANAAGEQRAEEHHKQVQEGSRQPEATAEEREAARWADFDSDAATVAGS